MSHKIDLTDRRRAFPDIREEMGQKFRRVNHEMITNKNGQVETEKRKRREVANCNERRRMQSINTGFENLRVMLPPIQDGEKLSKATILQLTAKFINSLILKVNALEKELSVYRQSGSNGVSILADITDEVSTSFSRKRRSEDHGKQFDSLKSDKQSDPESALLELDDGNTSGRSSECYDNHFIYSPSSSVQQVANIVSDSSTESTTSTAARLEHLVMAIEQIEGGTPMDACVKAETLTDAYVYDYHSHAPCCKFSDSVTSELHQYSYSLHTTDSHLLKPNITPFTEEFILNSPSSELPSNLIPVNVCDEKNLKVASINDYPLVAKLLNRPIPHKYLHRPQVVVNNSH